VHWSRVDDVLHQASDLSGKVILTCSLPMDAGNARLVIGYTTSGAEELARKVPKAEVVSAFNTVPSEVLFGVYKARRRATGPVSSTVATMRAAKKSPPDSSATWDLSRWMRDLCGLPATPSRLRC
jgi:predicted dinucleotide-binding enzyme